jgi:hypothetical protein
MTITAINPQNMAGGLCPECSWENADVIDLFSITVTPTWRARVSAPSVTLEAEVSKRFRAHYTDASSGCVDTFFFFEKRPLRTSKNGSVAAPIAHHWHFAAGTRHIL